MRTSVARGALLGFAGQAWHLAATFFLYAFLARQLGPELFGQWRVVLSVLGWFEIVLYSGITSVATKAIAEKPEDAPSLSRATYLGQGIVVAAVVVLMVVLAGPVAGSLSDPALTTYIRISALDVPFYALFMSALAVLLGTQRFERQVVAMAAYSAAKVVAIGVLVAVGFSVTGALVGNALASVIGFAVAFVPLPGERAPMKSLTPVVRWLYVASVPFITLSLVSGVGRSADLWLVSATVASSVAVGWYASATVLAEVPLFIFDGLSRVLFPSIARSLSEDDKALSSRYAVQAVRLGLMVTVLVVGLVVGSGRQILQFIYSEEFLGAYLPFAILTVASVGRVTQSSCTHILMAQDRRVLANTILVVTLGIQLALLVVAAARYGAVGAAAAASTAAVLAGVWSAVAVRDLLGFRPVATLARCGAAAALVGLALYSVPFPPGYVLLALPIGAIVYLVLLSLFGEIGRDDYAAVRAAIGR